MTGPMLQARMRDCSIEQGIWPDVGVGYGGLR